MDSRAGRLGGKQMPALFEQATDIRHVRTRADLPALRDATPRDARRGPSPPTPRLTAGERG